jgi:regulatory protein
MPARRNHEAGGRAQPGCYFMKRNAPRSVARGTPTADDGALNNAYRILARRDHTFRELQAKLRRRGFSGDAIAHAISRCRRLGYLDDAKIALMLAGRLSERGYGPLRIRQALAQKGLDEKLIENALRRHDDEDSQIRRARQWLEKRRSRLLRQSDPYKRRQMAYRLLAGRGFCSGAIRRAVDDE